MNRESPSHNPPRITVIIAVRNGAKTLQRALDSILEQTYDDVELVVMDGASTDGTQAILERNTARIAFWRSEPDGGIYQAWNKALAHATGDWICFLGADDRYHAPTTMARVAPVLADDAGRHRVAYGLLEVVDGDGSMITTKGFPWDDRRRRRFRRGKMIRAPATFHHRTLFEDNGQFDERFKIVGDYELLLRELLDHDPLFLEEVIVDMGIGGISNNPRYYSTLLRERHQAQYMHGLVPTPPWRSRRLLRQLASIWIAGRVAAARRFVTRPRRRVG